MAKREKPARFIQNTIALVYDFDGTLTPQPMQAYTVLKDLGIRSDTFWDEVEAEEKRTHGDRILTYMRLLIDRAERGELHWNPQAFKRMGRSVEYYPGVERWFDRINAHVARASARKVRVKHYVISSGMKEILDGIRIRRRFARIYACEYFFDQHQRPIFPKVVINDTNKTQFLFRINKGREDLDESINEYMPESIRPIPFSNILYIGDGLTDVPCMTVTKKHGGHAVAVHRSRSAPAIDTCRQLLDGGRIDYFAPADYREGKLLDKRVRLILDLMVARIRCEREAFACRREAQRRRQDD